MEMTPSGDQISRLLHVVVIEICQRIVSYTDELVVSGMVFVTADGVEVCRVSFEDAMKGKGQNGESQMDNSPFQEDNQKPHLLLSSDFAGDCVIPARFSDNVNLRKDHGISSSGTPTINSSKKKAAGKTADCFVEESAQGCGTDARILKHKGIGLRNGLMVNGSHCSSSVSNLGEMVMECWQQITPELLKVSTLLCKLGELQKAIDAQNVALSDQRISSRKLSTCARRLKQFCGNEQRGSDWMPLRSNFSQTLVSDYRVRNQCRLCQKVFTFATNLIRHQRNFHGRPYSRGTKRANGSKVMFGNRRLLTDLSRFGSHRMNSLVSGEHSGQFLPRPTDSLVTEHPVSSAEILDQELEGKFATADVNASTGHSKADQDLEKEIREDTVALVVCPDEELQVCDVEPDGEKTLAAESRNCALSVSTDATRKTSSLDTLKAFDTIQDRGISTNPANVECYPFDDCSCWDKSGDSMLDPISVDVCDDNSTHYFEDCCSLDGSGPTTSVYTGDVLAVTTNGNTFPKTMITETITVGSPNSARSVELQEPRMKKFNCSLCNASFSMSNNLQRHVKKIHGSGKDSVRPRKAPAFESALDVLNCESAAELKMTRSSRYRHICVVCGAAFTFRTNLTRHMKKIHHQIPVDVSSTARPRGSLSPRP